jgi:hypothetical protein
LVVALVFGFRGALILFVLVNVAPQVVLALKINSKNCKNSKMSLRMNFLPETT